MFGYGLTVGGDLDTLGNAGGALPDKRPIAKRRIHIAIRLINLLFKSFSLHGVVLGSKGNKYARTLNSSKFP